MLGEPVGHDVGHLGVAPAEGVVAVQENQGDRSGDGGGLAFDLIGGCPRRPDVR